MSLSALSCHGGLIVGGRCIKNPRKPILPPASLHLPCVPHVSDLHPHQENIHLISGEQQTQRAATGLWSGYLISLGLCQLQRAGGSWELGEEFRNRLHGWQLSAVPSGWTPPELSAY